VFEARSTIPNSFMAIDIVGVSLLHETLVTREQVAAGCKDRPKYAFLAVGRRLV